MGEESTRCRFCASELDLWPVSPMGVRRAWRRCRRCGALLCPRCVPVVERCLCCVGGELGPI